MTIFLTDDEAQRLRAAHEALERHGVIAADADYDVPTLAAAIYARRWSYSIDRSGADFRATITMSDGAHRGLHATGVAWAQEIALAFALENALKTSR